MLHTARDEFAYKKDYFMHTYTDEPERLQLY